jgi:hypothetical protein
MAEHDPPPPLKTGADASPELVRALKALGRDTDAARLARVGAKIGPLLDAPAPSLPPAATWWQLALRKLSLPKLALTGVVLGAAAIAFIRSPFDEVAHSPAPPPAAPLEAPASGEIAADRTPAAQPSAAPGEPTRAAEPAAGHATARTSAATTKRPSRQASTKPASSAARSRSAEAAQTLEPTAAAQPSAESAAKEDAEPIAEEAKPAAKPVLPPPAAPGAAPLSEADLLYGARKALRNEPAAALRLLDEHAARFQGGLLAPEREVLAIEALRNLGRTAQATKRLQQFKARYPKSIHLRRLEGKDGGAPER